MNERQWRLVWNGFDGDSHGRPGKLVKIVMTGALVLGAGVLLSRVFFLQMTLGNRQALVAEGNRLERRVVLADRGVIKDRNGVVLARNGVDDEQGVVREYPFGVVGAHVVGYVGEASREELDNADELQLGTVIGKAGIEKQYEQLLRGKVGEELWEVNSKGEDVRLIGKKYPVPGEDIKLSLDVELQKKIVGVLRKREEESGDTQGAVVVSNVEGEILAMVSWPSFDTNLFSGLGGSGEYASVEEVLGDGQRLPMFNRAIAGGYPPGSVFKLVTATAGLQTGKIDAGTTVRDEGEIVIDEYRYGNWYFDQYGKTEGEVDLKKALARSNDIFFYKVGEWVGQGGLQFWAEKLGLGRQTGIDLGGEVAGRVPTPLWKERLTGERWFLGNTYHMAIGQGDLLTTPLQINRMTAAVVSGKKCRSGLRQREPSCEDVGVDLQTRKIILEGMERACRRGEDYKGTAFTFFDFEGQVACKTGTAQQGGEDDDPHAWITVVVPGEQGYKDGVVVTVMLEAAGEGSAEAGPVASEIVEYLFDKEDL